MEHSWPSCCSPGKGVWEQEGEYCLRITTPPATGHWMLRTATEGQRLLFTSSTAALGQVSHPSHPLSVYQWEYQE